MTVLGDIWKFSIINQTWESLKVEGNSPVVVPSVPYAQSVKSLLQPLTYESSPWPALQWHHPIFSRMPVEALTMLLIGNLALALRMRIYYAEAILSSQDDFCSWLDYLSGFFR